MSSDDEVDDEVDDEEEDHDAPVMVRHFLVCTIESK